MSQTGPTLLPATAGMLMVAACASLPADEVALASLVEAERAFARMAVEQNVRAAFIANVADDGILFRPGPVRAREWFATEPPSPDPRAMLLEWEPAASGIAASRDFGFTTGPARASLRAGGKPPAHFVYFSVWKREPTGRWRVAIDAGTSVPDAVAPRSLAPGPATPGRHVNGASIDRLAAIERNAPRDVDVFAGWLADDALLLRDGAPPVSGRAARQAVLAESTARSFEPAGGDIARSGDLAYSYGTWRATGASGYYVHLWARDAAGRWKIAVAVQLAG